MQALNCIAQRYDWGKIAQDSLVYQLRVATNPEGLSGSDRYSELWMGTHPNGPSALNSGELLSNYLADFYKDKEPNSWEGNQPGSLPYLFKVLSIDKPLSIQAHPNKELATVLHEKFPNIYKDPNHKPELACALTPFEALCGFRYVNDIIGLIETTAPELGQLLGEDLVASVKSSNDSDDIRLKMLFSQLMNSSNDSVVQRLRAFIERLSKQDQKNEIESLALRVHNDFPDDVGVFCVFFLNYVQLKPGEAIFLGPNLPHAYLSGNCIECMACSDNVVRAGLTPKLRDADTLCSMLDYNATPAKVLQGDQIDDHTRTYDPPVDEFKLYQCQLPSGIDSYSFPLAEKNSPSILLVVEGNGKVNTGEQSLDISKGSVLFIHPGKSITVQSSSELQLFLCTCC